MLFRNWVKNFLLLLVCILTGATLIIIINGLTTGGSLDPFNTGIEQIVSHLRTPFLTSFMLLVTNIGSPFILSLVAIILSTIILLNRDTFDALLFIVSMGLSAVSLSILKSALHMPRPAGSLVEVTSWSFPSGHATLATAFFFSVAYTFFDRLNTYWSKALLVLSCIVSAALISLSRIYLGAHFALDVLGGVALGLLSVSFTIFVFNIFLEERHLPRRKKLDKSI